MAFFGLLKKKRKFDEPIIDNSKTKMNDPSKTDPILQMMSSIPDNETSLLPMKTYDILVFEPNPDGTKKQEMVNGVKAHSPNELIALYAADGAQVQILKEYGGQEPTSPAKQQKLPQQQQSKLSVKDFSNDLTSLNRPIEHAFHEATKPAKQPPKYFEIGGIKCKLEDGKMFQEQWVRVDASKYRLIADATNKLVSMNGKHLETLKWVQIENSKETNSGEETENA